MEDIKDYKLWCKQNDLKENNYKSLKLYLAGKAIKELTIDVHMNELLYAIECIVAAAKEEANDMLEKLNQAKRYLDAAIRNV